MKHYEQRADNQECVLAAFEEEGWPFRVDHPLPRGGHQGQRERLHATLRGLNAHQRVPLLRFRANGTGKAICWEFVAASTPGAHPEHTRIAP